MEGILLTSWGWLLRLVVDPIIYRFFHIPGGDHRIAEIWGAHPANARNSWPY